jgi:hypothetical protein
MGCASSKPVTTAAVSASTTNADAAAHAAAVKSNADSNDAVVKEVEKTAERRGTGGEYFWLFYIRVYEPHLGLNK